MTLHAITVLGLNLEDSSMTLLRGHFAMTLVCAGEVIDADIAAALAPLSHDGQLTVTVREVPVEEAAAPAGSSWVLTVHGGDRPGIVSAVAGEIARVGGNVTDLTTRPGRDVVRAPASVLSEGGEPVDPTAAETVQLAADLPAPQDPSSPRATRRPARAA